MLSNIERTKSDQPTIAAFLDVNLANIPAIFSKACFSSIAASSCFTAVEMYQLSICQSYIGHTSKLSYLKHLLKFY